MQFLTDKLLHQQFKNYTNINFIMHVGEIVYRIWRDRVASHFISGLVERRKDMQSVL